MADSTVGALTAASALTGTELFYGVQAANDVKVTASQIATFAGGGGGGGTTILDGSGPPANSLGSAGDYYVDNAADIMYGPKSSGSPFGSTENILGGTTPVLGGGSGSYLLGNDYNVLLAGQAVGVRFWRMAGTPTARTIYLYDTTSQALITTVATTAETGSGWITVMFPTPVSIPSPQGLTVAIEVNGAFAQDDPPTSVTDPTHAVFVRGRYRSIPGSGFPTNLLAKNHFADLLWEAGISLWPVAVASGGMAIGGAVTSGTNKSILFVDSGSNLAQDNANLFWDDTNNIFHIGYGMDFAGVRGFYRIPHGSGDNWFAGGSGNITLTGHDNFGFGQGTLASLTSGNYNTASGTFALSNCTTGQFNFAFGLSSLRNTTSGGNNTAIGPFAMTNATTANFNVAFGDSALNSTNGANNVAIGTNSAGSSTGSYNAFIGSNVVGALTSGDYNVVIGGLALANSTSGIQNTLIGYGAGYHLSGGSNNTLIGGWQGPSASMSNVIALSQGNFGSSIAPVADFGYSNNGWTFVATSKAGAPAASDLPSGSFAVIDDTSGGQTWLVFNKAGTIRKVQLV